MKTIELKKIRRAMEKSLDAKRFEHTLGVEYTAAALAMRYGVPIKDAQMAGLLHDCAKCYSDEKLLSFCDKHNISANEVERRNPSLLHAKVGSFVAMEEYNVNNPEIIHAILNHTTGRPGMSLLEKIIFIADYIEPGRDKASNLAEVRELAFVNLDNTLLTILRDTLQYLEDTKSDIDPMTQKTYEYYSNLIRQEKECDRNTQTKEGSILDE